MENLGKSKRSFRSFSEVIGSAEPKKDEERNVDTMSTIFKIKKSLEAIRQDRKWTQEELGEVLSVTKATANSYLDEKTSSLPSITSLFKLRKRTGISLDELCDTDFDPSTKNILDEKTIKNYRLYLGNYHLAYYSTNNIESHDTESTVNQRISYGVMSIVKDTEEGDDVKESYHVYAIFSLSYQESVALKNVVDGCTSYYETIEQYKSHPFYAYGLFDFVNGGKFACFSMKSYGRTLQTEEESLKNYPMDFISVYLYNPLMMNTAKKSNYIGGNTLVASTSRGRVRVPCSQKVIMSRFTYPEDTEKKIEELLQLQRPNVSINQTMDDVFEKCSSVFEQKSLPEQLKKDIVAGFLKSAILDVIKEQTMQFQYITDSEDNKTYHFIKMLSQTVDR